MDLSWVRFPAHHVSAQRGPSEGPGNGTAGPGRCLVVDSSSSEGDLKVALGSESGNLSLVAASERDLGHAGWHSADPALGSWWRLGGGGSLGAGTFVLRRRMAWHITVACMVVLLSPFACR